jgi:PST family polysaccharide transporter
MALLIRPMQQVLQPVTAVFVPALSRLQDDEDRYRRMFLQAYDAMALAGLVIAGWFIALAHPLTLVLLGGQWEGAATIFGWLAVAALYSPVANAALWLLVTQGRGREVLLVNLANGALAIAAYVAGLPWGPAGVALGWSASGLMLRTPLYFHVAGRRGPVRTSTLFSRFVRLVPVGVAVVGATALACRLTQHASPFVQLAVSAPVGLLAAIAIVLAYPPARATAARIWTAIREQPSLKALW